MRKLLIWFLAALMALSGFALAETAAPAAEAAQAAAANGGDAVRLGTELYFPIPNGAQQMLVRVDLEGGDPVCIDQGDRIEDLLPFADGVVYLKTENGATSIVACNGAQLSTIYSFGTSSASNLSCHDGKLLVLIDGLLHSIEPGTQLCLRLSGSQMLDCVVEGDSAYFLSGGDRMEYTANLPDGEKISTQAGCIYALNLSTGETTLLLKSGARDLSVRDGMLYFHNLANAYAIRTADNTQLMGRVGSLDIQQRALGDECTEADGGFWALDGGLVIWYSGALNVETEAGTLALYTPANGATVVSDGESLYAWEPDKSTLTQVQTNGATQVVYAGDLRAAISLAEAAAAAPEGDDIGTDVDPDASDNWFDDYMDDGSGSGSGSSGWPGATPIAATPTPRPAPTPVTLDDDDDGPSGSSGSGSGSGGSGSGSGSSGTFAVNITYLKLTGDVFVRSGPGTNYKAKSSLEKGDVVICTGRGAKDSSGKTWYQITHDGSKGWVSSRYAKKTNTSSSGKTSEASGTRVTQGTVNIRSGPGLTFSSKGNIGSGVTIKITQKSVDARGVTWFKTSYGGVTGWVSSKYLKNPNSSSGSGGGGNSDKVVTTGQVTIRSKPNKNADSLGYIGSGKTVSYLGKSKVDSRGVRWYKIKYQGVTGWISSKYSRIK